MDKTTVDKIEDDLIFKPSENFVDVYYERLIKSDNPAYVIGLLYRDLFKKFQITQQEITTFNELIRIFGRTNLFFSILDVATLNIRGNPYELLFKVCKSRVERNYNIYVNNSYISLDGKVKEREKEIARLSKLKIELKGIDE